MRTSLFVYIACLAVGVTTASAQDYSELLTASFPADATWLITNPSFETGDETGWTLIGKDPNGNDEFKTRDYGMSGKRLQMFLAVSMSCRQWSAHGKTVL